jgi:flagella basal body P-ring formation protein FlgA
MAANSNITDSPNGSAGHPPMSRWLLSALLTLLALRAGIAAGGGYPVQSRESNRDAVNAFITQGIKKEYPHHEIRVSKLDPRLTLAECEIPLEGFLPKGGQLIGNISVGIRCSGGSPWTIYVPASVKVMRKVVVASHPILRRATIDSGDIHLEQRDIATGSAAYIFNPEDVLGKVAKRAAAASTALTPDMLDEPLLIHRGQQVIILAEGPGIQVRMAGTALMDGTEGQIIKAKNKLSKRTVEGRVVQPGIIRVNM